MSEKLFGLLFILGAFLCLIQIGLVAVHGPTPMTFDAAPIGMIGLSVLGVLFFVLLIALAIEIFKW